MYSQPDGRVCDKCGSLGYRGHSWECSGKFVEVKKNDNESISHG